MDDKFLINKRMFCDNLKGKEDDDFGGMRLEEK